MNNLIMELLLNHPFACIVTLAAFLYLGHIGPAGFRYIRNRCRRLNKTLASEPPSSSAYPFPESKIVTLREHATRVPQLIDSPEGFVKLWRDSIEQSPSYRTDQECLYAAWLNSRNKLVGWAMISMGSVDAISIHPRELFRPAVIANAASIIFGHNHPSGDSSPSSADIDTTKRLCKAGETLGIKILDHVVIGNNEHKSLRSLGYID